MPVWCTNRSLPWSSGVMNPNPFSSLNHFTVPVAMGSSLGGRVLRNAGGAKATTTDAGTTSPDRLPGTMPISLPWSASRRRFDRLSAEAGLRAAEFGRRGLAVEVLGGDRAPIRAGPQPAEHD